MSRSFAGANNHALTRASCAIPSTGSILVWAYSAFANNDGLSHWLFNITASGPKILDCVKYSDNKTYIGWYNSGTDGRFFDAVSFTQNAWNALLLCWTSGGNASIFLNGGSASKGATGIWDTSAQTLYLGNVAALNGAWKGKIGLVCLWNVDLTGLGNGFYKGAHPYSVAPGNIQAFWPMWGVDPEIMAAGTLGSLTVSGSTVVDNGPPVAPFMPLGVHYNYADSLGGTAFTNHDKWPFFRGINRGIGRGM